jgi:hypothetical protein
MTKRVVILAVAVGLAFASQPALAGSRGGGGGHSGGGHSGGGHSGGGHAVARGSGSGYAPHSLAAARHPSGGGGYYSSGHGSYSHGSYSHGSYGHGSYGHGSYGHGYYGHSYYGHSHGYGYGYGYYPYYGGYYGGYYGSGFGLSLGFGPYAYGSLYYGWPGSYGYPDGSTNVYVQPSDSGSDDPGYRRPPEARVQGDYVPNTGRVRLEVRPEDASVYVDDEYWGNASDSRQLTLRAGRHMIELVRPGLPVARREVDVIAGQSADVLVDLQRQ